MARMEESLLHDVVAQALKAGADQAEVVGAERQALSINVRLGALEEVEREESRDLSLRVFVGRRHATVSANRTNNRRQAGHLMTASQSRKSAHRARCRFIGHGRVRPDIQPSPQIGRQLTAFNAARRSFVSHSPFGQPAGSVQFQSHTASAAFQSP